MVPAPMFTPGPTVASPMYERWGALEPSPSVVFLSSTKLPTLALAPMRVSGRMCAKGPTADPGLHQGLGAPDAQRPRGRGQLGDAVDAEPFGGILGRQRRHRLPGRAEQ